LVDNVKAKKAILAVHQRCRWGAQSQCMVGSTRREE